MSLFTCIDTAFKEVWNIVRLSRDDMDEDLKPEYLTTGIMLSNLANEVSDNNITGITLKIEAPTREMLASSLWFPRPRRFTRLILRHGKADIAIYRDDQLVTIIENKLYISGFSGIRKDVLRGIEFLCAQNCNGGGSIMAAVSTFYWKEKRGKTKEDHLDACRNSFKDILDKTWIEINNKSCNSKISVSYKFKCLNSTAFRTKNEACAPDEDGKPEYDGNDIYSLYTGVIILFRPDRITVPSPESDDAKNWVRGFINDARSYPPECDNPVQVDTKST